jgi:hypothetical protein
MNRFFHVFFALFLGACSVPDFGVIPSGSCAEQVQNGKACAGLCPACEVGQGCEGAADCASGVCEGNLCVPAPTCTDQKINGAETDIDCGGGTCSACALNASCTRASDCVSALCDAGVCAPMPTCTDFQINGAETDTDCGGGTCPACALDLHCTRASDCESGLCKLGACAIPAADPSCSDLQQNATETDIDCGGSCNPCAVDKRCSKAGDCVTQVCLNVCQPAGCKDGVRNGVESDKDCGGSCAGCDVGFVCKANTDCKSLSCSSGHCIANTCSDTIKNGTETGKDCGGAGCGACPGGEGCTQISDCASLICSNKTCTTASCTDNTKNGTESETDCGKGCKGCQPGQFCNTGADCASATCTQNYCVPNSPSGGTLDMTDWIATASDVAGSSKASFGIDNKFSSRWASGTAQYSGMSFVVDMMKPQIFFGLSLDSQDQVGDCPALFDVFLSMTSSFPATPTLKSVVGTPLTDLTFPGNKAVVARYVKFVLTSGKPPDNPWWGIRELAVKN